MHGCLYILQVATSNMNSDDLVCSACQLRRSLDHRNWDVDGSFKDGGPHTVYFSDDEEVLPDSFRRAAERAQNLCAKCQDMKTQMGPWTPLITSPPLAESEAVRQARALARAKMIDNQYLWGQY